MEAWIKAGAAGMMKSRDIRDVCQSRRDRSYQPVLLSWLHSLSATPTFALMENKTTLFAEQARTVSWVAKVAVTLSGFPTQLSEKQILSSAALSAPLCIRTALHVTELLKLWIAMLCQAILC